LSFVVCLTLFTCKEALSTHTEPFAHAQIVVLDTREKVYGFDRAKTFSRI
jgi:hypothetical protein